MGRNPRNIVLFAISKDNLFKNLQLRSKSNIICRIWMLGIKKLVCIYRSKRQETNYESFYHN